MNPNVTSTDQTDTPESARIVSSAAGDDSSATSETFPRVAMSDRRSEVRYVDPISGGEKGTKLARFDLIPEIPLYALAEHYGRGAGKYDDHNWRRGYPWSISFAALNRHLWTWWNGEDVDPELHSHHLDAVAWHAFALREFVETHPSRDDRPTYARGKLWVPPEEDLNR